MLLHCLQPFFRSSYWVIKPAGEENSEKEVDNSSSKGIIPAT
ncbi:hypothetical protein GPEL0_01r4722 [Geoanaerobacter pelophilus]|uniref:Uncharacterized protein n=1 Tax=Geoanaerobacter pelophilus TaxID=60036 RepID=A0ABQ0MMT8_9BACT|nr:hypothetical protein GPEL0_01r4722 [Geoanaerobacter pelophilus]